MTPYTLVEAQRRFGETRYHSHRQWRKRVPPEYWSNRRTSHPETLTEFLTAILAHNIRWQPHSNHSKITNSFPEPLVEAKTLTSSIQTAHACYTGLKLWNSYQNTWIPRITSTISCTHKTDHTKGNKRRNRTLLIRKKAPEMDLVTPKMLKELSQKGMILLAYLTFRNRASYI